MVLFEWTLALLVMAVLLTGVSKRLGAPYPALLALAGAALAFAPSVPDIQINPELALALFVAPVLLDAAFDTSPRDLKRNAVPLASLVLVAVGLTTAAVTWVGWRLGGLPIAAAIALGAIVAPPDAAAAAAILGPLRLPRRIQQVLQGESLLNDASALIVYRIAVAAAISDERMGHVGLLMIGLIVSPLAGYLLARAQVLITSQVRDSAAYTVLGFVGTFGVWLLADRLHLSAIITVVAYAMTLAHMVPARLSARSRVSSYSVWETAVFVLNVLAFVIMGLQARHIVNRLSKAELGQAVLVAAAVLAAVILVRVGYVMAYNTGVRLKNRWLGVHLAAGVGVPTYKSGVVISWCGMRGLVTLAAAFALPPFFPGRDLIVFCAFSVVLGTLILQGFTLRPLLKLLQLRPDDAVEREVAAGRAAMLQAALARLQDETSAAAAAVREHYLAARAVAQTGDHPQDATEHDRLRLWAIAAERAEINALRASGAIGDEAYHRLEEELDWAELDAAPAGYFQPLTTDGEAPERPVVGPI